MALYIRNIMNYTTVVVNKKEEQIGSISAQETRKLIQLLKDSNARYQVSDSQIKLQNKQSEKIFEELMSKSS